MTNHFTHDRDAEIAALYADGLTTYEIATRFGVSPTPIRRALERQGATVRRAGRRTAWTGTSQQIAEVAAAYQSGESILAIARRLKVRDSSVIEALDSAGVERRHMGSQPMFDAATVDAIVAGYFEGRTLTELAEQYGTNHVTIRNHLKRRGVSLRPSGVSLFWTAERKAETMRRYEAGESQQQIAAALGCQQTGVSNALREMGVSTRGVVPSGPGHPSWRGGRVIDQQGYVRVKPTDADADLVKAHHNGYVMEHRLVMARALGRPLTRRETVHHINGDRADCRLENLQLRQGMHGKGVVMTCKDCGSHNVEATALK